MAASKIRLDQLLTQRGLAASRSRARDMITRGCVTVDGRRAGKHGQQVAGDCTIKIDDEAAAYVSRAALKLIAGLDAAQFSANGKTCLDLGASTGGFTQVLLERGARHVNALDVGHGQITDSLRGDKRVTVLEKFNARDLTLSDLPEPPEIVVSDMSFISLRIAAEPALRLAHKKALAVLLVKPQFEVGRDAIGKGGLVTDTDRITTMLDEIKSWFEELPGWTLCTLVPSPIEGGDGNKEYLLCGRRNA